MNEKLIHQIKILAAVIITAAIIYLLFRKKAPVIEVVESPIKSLYNYNIPPMVPFEYTPKNFGSCGCKPKTATNPETKTTGFSLSNYVTNMSGYLS